MARGQDPDFARVDTQLSRVTGVLQHMEDSARGKSIASAHTEAAHLAQALGSVHAGGQPGQRAHLLARAEVLRGLVRNMDEYVLPAQRQDAMHGNAELADRLLRRGPEHFRIASSAGGT